MVGSRVAAERVRFSIIQRAQPTRSDPSVQLGSEIDDLTERKLKDDLAAIIDDFEKTREPIHGRIRLLLEQITGRRTRSLPGLVGIG
jgi:hypothetical protein